MSADRLEQLVHRVRAIEDVDTRDAVLALVQGVMDLHAAGLEAMMDSIAASEQGERLLEDFAKAPPIGNLLLLHDLHPHDIETRVRKALEPFEADGGVDSLSVHDGLVQVRIHGDAAFTAAVRQALGDAAPDAAAITVEATEIAAAGGFVPLTQLLAGGVR